MTDKNGFLYCNRRLGFTVRLPEYWKSYIQIRNIGRCSGAARAVRFLFDYEGTVYGDVLTVLVYNMRLKRWKQLYDDSPIGLIGEFGGRVYAYTVPEELPYVFVDPETGEYDYEKYGEQIRLMKQMVNDDVPRIIRTFRKVAKCGLERLPPAPFLAPGITPGPGIVRD